MFKTICAICFCVVTLPAFCQSTAKYEVATIVDVKPHQPEVSPDTVSYDVSLKVGSTIYVVLYTPPFQETSAKYAAGRNLLVSVGEKTITSNDIIGRSVKVPILSKKPADEAKQGK